MLLAEADELPTTAAGASAKRADVDKPGAAGEAPASVLPQKLIDVLGVE